uniref:Nei endonuclease VIII-like 1 n=1 Tax=Nothobranchius rachovii TaxID=451742 RepID=A0A1A8SKY9_9TELE
MPEGPELHLASQFVNKMCDGVVFSGPVRKSEVSKNPDVPFTCEAYCITATSRGKEVKLTLTPIKCEDDLKRRAKGRQVDQPMDVVFRFGMSGYFRFTGEDELPKHAHLCFYTKEKPRRVLSFVDTRRFGSWQPNGTWQPDRGPCIMFEYKRFRPNIPPFVCARNVLEGLELEDTLDEKTVKNEFPTSKKSKKKTMNQESGDLLRLCHTVPLEVVSLGGKGYDPEKTDYSTFMAWLQCYYVDGMKTMRDHNGRTMWFQGDPGPMAPKGSKSPKPKKRVKKEDDHDYTEKEKAAESRCESTTKKQRVVKRETSKREGNARSKEVTSKRGKTQEVMQLSETRPKSRKRKSNNTDKTSGEQSRTGRVTRKNSK